MNRLPSEKRAQILGMMVEGVSIRAIARMTGASKNTIVKLLRDAGQACADYQDRTLRNLSCRRLQLDEIWSFVYAKQKNVPENKWGQAGDVWTWTAIDADTKLIASWMLGDRSADTARAFVKDLAERLTDRVQLTTDGLPHYKVAVERAFGADIDYAMLDKIYKSAKGIPEGKYSPGECVGAKKKPMMGNPDPAHVSTSFAERMNLNIRMGLRRFTRLTNAFSKKIENHFFALAVYFMHYNFVRIHQTLRVSPAMAAGVTNRLWEMADLVEVLDKWEEARSTKQERNC
jgi:IS1 family transposase